jgi:hypothetical protein
MYIHLLLPTGSRLKLVPPKISECGSNDCKDDPSGRKDRETTGAVHDVPTSVPIDSHFQSDQICCVR